MRWRRQPPLARSAPPCAPQTIGLSLGSASVSLTFCDGRQRETISLGFVSRSFAIRQGLCDSRRGETLGFRPCKSRRSEPLGFRLCSSGSPSFYLNSRSFHLGVRGSFCRQTISLGLDSRGLAINLGFRESFRRQTIGLCLGGRRLAICLRLCGDFDHQTIRGRLGGRLSLGLKLRAIADVRDGRHGGHAAGFMCTQQSLQPAAQEATHYIEGKHQQRDLEPQPVRRAKASRRRR